MSMSSWLSAALGPPWTTGPAGLFGDESEPPSGPHPGSMLMQVGHQLSVTVASVHCAVLSGSGPE